MDTLETSRTACLAETSEAERRNNKRSVPAYVNRQERGNNKRSVPAYVNRQPIHIPYDSFVVFSWEVSGCPAIFPGDSALRHENPPVRSPTARELDRGFGALLGGSMAALSRADAA